MSDKLGDLEKSLNHLGQIFRYVNEVILNPFILKLKELPSNPRESQK